MKARSARTGVSTFPLSEIDARGRLVAGHRSFRFGGLRPAELFYVLAPHHRLRCDLIKAPRPGALTTRNRTHRGLDTPALDRATTLTR